jgi:hypothetical protein
MGKHLRSHISEQKRCDEFLGHGRLVCNYLYLDPTQPAFECAIRFLSIVNLISIPAY